jgi:hypothetical protein
MFIPTLSSQRAQLSQPLQSMASAPMPTGCPQLQVIAHSLINASLQIHHVAVSFQYAFVHASLQNSTFPFRAPAQRLRSCAKGLLGLE